MRVLQFAFDGRADNPYLPENYVANAVACTGTHDNPTTRDWFETLPDGGKRIVRNFLGRTHVESRDAAPALMEVAWSSLAALSVVPLQDLLNLGREARMNVPGTSNGNWEWRCTEEMLSDAAFEWLSVLTKNSSRCLQPAKVSALGSSKDLAVQTIAKASI